MIAHMAKIRVIGPQHRLDATLRWLQEFGLLHLSERPPEADGVSPRAPTPGERRRLRQLARMAADADAILATAGPLPPRERGSSQAGTDTLAQWARMLRRTRIHLDRLAIREAELEEELATIMKYEEFFDAFEPLLRDLSATPWLATHAVIVPASQRRNVSLLVEALAQEGRAECVAAQRVLRSGDLAVLVAVPARSQARFDELFSHSRLPELRVPTEFGGRSLAEALPRMKARLASIPRERAELSAERQRVHAASLHEVFRADAVIHDFIAQLGARGRCGVTSHAFTLEGWVPSADASLLIADLDRALGNEVAAVVLGGELWQPEEAPVSLHNPRVLRPFEAIVRMMPLPRYGSIDPTPFVAVFFPTMFGLIVGDIAYGVLMAAIGLVLHWRSRPGSLARTISEIMGPCAAFTILFGVLYGELLGNVGRNFLGLHHVVMDREESVVAFLFVALGLGVVHVAVGLVLGVMSKWRSSRRHAIGSGVTLVMVLLMIVAGLAAVRVFPESLLTPAIIALLVAVPVLVVAEGILAPIELLTTIGNIFSYARVMALGTAGVMLAVVANEMVGAIGSTVVGILFALLFHIVNFAIALFSPTIHVLRLHYVEFFGKFYSPGGRAYAPFRRWQPEPRS
jgi:V/A-type H+/Na+-transporting ATPase subunit I